MKHAPAIRIIITVAMIAASYITFSLTGGSDGFLTALIVSALIGLAVGEAVLRIGATKKDLPGSR